MLQDTTLLLALLNSRPLLDGVERDELGDDRGGRDWARARGGTGSTAELNRLRRLRDQLTDVVLDDQPASVLAEALEGVHQRPTLSETGVHWELVAEPDVDLPARIVLTWAWVTEHLPGRLRPCANDACRLFLLDRSKANKARWCSMATCGNRMKVRRHYERSKVHRQ